VSYRPLPAGLQRIVRSCCARRTPGKQPTITSIDRIADVPAALEDPADLAHQRDVQATVVAAVNALPDHERSVVLLFYFSGYAQHDIAALLDLPVATVKKRLQYARHRLHGPLVSLARDTLGLRRPSHDDRFVRAIQFVLALDAMDTERQHAADAVLELDGLDATRMADGEELLLWAAALGSFDLVDLLLQDGMDVDTRDAAGRTLLSCAVQRKDGDLAAELLRLGADRTLEDSSGTSPVQLAMVLGQPAMVALLCGGSALTPRSRSCRGNARSDDNAAAPSMTRC